MNPTLGVCYYPEHWPEDIWATDAARMVETGLTWVRIGEFAWTRMEPKPGHLDLAWLDRAIDTLGNAGLKVILGTPTATPPRWMVDKHPDMLARDEHNHIRKFGSRRHYCFSHQGYREESRRIARILGERYGNHPHITQFIADLVERIDGTPADADHAPADPFETEIRMLRKAFGSVAIAALRVFGIKLPESREELDSFVTDLIGGKLLK